MHWRSHSNSLILALAATTALISTCPAQEVGFLDLTKIKARLDVRRPEGVSPMTGGYRGTQFVHPCYDSPHTSGTLTTSLQLDGTHYQDGDEPTFEVRIENTGSTPLRIPFSPHLADLQPANPALTFAYSELRIVLWIAGGEKWSTNTGGNAVLYGANDHANTMLTLSPGEWVRVIGKGNLRLLNDQVLHLIKSGHPADHVYAQTLYIVRKLWPQPYWPRPRAAKCALPKS